MGGSWNNKSGRKQSYNGDDNNENDDNEDLRENLLAK